MYAGFLAVCCSVYCNVYCSACCSVYCSVTRATFCRAFLSKCALLFQYCVAACCSMLQRVAAYCSALLCVYPHATQTHARKRPHIFACFHSFVSGKFLWSLNKYIIHEKMGIGSKKKPKKYMKVFSHTFVHISILKATVGVHFCAVEKTNVL